MRKYTYNFLLNNGYCPSGHFWTTGRIGLRQDKEGYIYQTDFWEIYGAILPDKHRAIALWEFIDSEEDGPISLKFSNGIVIIERDRGE